MADFITWLSEPYIGFLLTPSILLFAWVLKFIWRNPRGGWGITEHGFGIDHGIQIIFKGDFAKIADSGTFFRMPVVLQFTNTLDKRIRIQNVDLRMVRDTLRKKEIAKCNLLAQDGSTFQFNCIIPSLEDSPKCNAVLTAPVTASWMHAFLMKQSILFEFTIWRIPDTPKRVTVLVSGIQPTTIRFTSDDNDNAPTDTPTS